jgi:hypothetical protein
LTSPTDSSISWRWISMRRKHRKHLEQEGPEDPIQHNAPTVGSNREVGSQRFRGRLEYHADRSHFNQ